MNPYVYQCVKSSFDNKNQVDSSSQESGDKASGQRLGVANQPRKKVLSTISKVANDDTTLTLATDNPELHGAAAKPLASHSISLIADLPEHKLISILNLLEFDVNLMKLLKEGQRLDLFFNLSVPISGFFNPTKFFNVMHSLCVSSYEDAFPKTVIGVGSGRGFIEKCFGMMGGVNVKCYDLEPRNEFIPVEQAEFPKDIRRVLPDDCSDCVLVAGYPHGYLGPVLVEFIQRGGEMLCTTVEGSLFGPTHADEVDPNVLHKAINELRKKNRAFFQVECSNVSSKPQPLSYIQFYNWPPSVKRLMSDDPKLKDLCSDIDFSDQPRMRSSIG